MGTCGLLFPLLGFCFTWWLFIAMAETSSKTMMRQFNPCNESEMMSQFNPCIDGKMIPQLTFAPEANLTSMNVTSVSDLTCAIQAKQRKALAYIYESGTCSLLGVGQVDDCKKVIYAPWELPYFAIVEEVANGKACYASPNIETYTCEKAIDYDMTTISLNDFGIQKPWWLVDLGETKNIYQVKVLPRQNLFLYKTHDTEIRIGTTLRTDGSFSSYSLMSYYTGPYTLDQGILTFTYEHPFIGRYLSVQQMITNPDDFLQIVEIAVFAAKN